jgi:hypothetical protein
MWWLSFMIAPSLIGKVTVYKFAVMISIHKSARWYCPRGIRRNNGAAASRQLC